MTKETWEYLETLGYRDYVYIKKSCSKISNQTGIISSLEEFCDSKIKKYEESELIDFLGQRIDGIAANPLDLVFTIKDWSCEMLNFVKDVYDCIYAITKEEEYKTVSDYIGLVSLYKNRVNQAIIETINDIPEDKQENFMKLIPETGIDTISNFQIKKLMK